MGSVDEFRTREEQVRKRTEEIEEEKKKKNK